MKRRALLLALVLALPLVVRSLELRLPWMTRPLWEDEVHHNWPVLVSHDAADLDATGAYRAQMQPKLDFVLRKYVWFPLLGVNERAMRIPSLVYAIALVLLVYGSLVVFCSRRLPVAVAVGLAAIASLWIVTNPMEVFYASEGRHYSFVALASTLFFAVLFLFRGRPRWLLGASAVLFCNTHFFALPIVACGYALQIGREIRDRKPWWIAFHSAVCLVIAALTLTVNWAALEPLLKQPPGAVAAGDGVLAMLRPGTIAAGLVVWRDCAAAIDAPPATWLVWLAITVAVLARRRWDRLPLVVAAFGVYPLLFLYMRHRSSYPIGERYFSAFFGIGIVTIGIAIDCALDEWQRYAPRLRAPRIAAVLALCAFAIVFGAPRAAIGLVADAGALHRIPKNFSPYFRAYDEIVADHHPAFILHTHCWTNDIQSLYFYYVLLSARPNAPHDLWLDWTDVLNCERPLAVVRRDLQTFLTTRMSQGGEVVLDDKEVDCASRSLPRVPPPATVEKFRSVHACMWKVRGVATVAQLGEVARLLGFRGASALR